MSISIPSATLVTMPHRAGLRVVAPEPGSLPLVACVSTDEDVTKLLRILLTYTGYRVATVVGLADSYLEAAGEVLAPLRPDAALVTVSGPRELCWRRVQRLLDVLPSCGLVLATPDPRMLTALPDVLTADVPLLAMPFDIDDVCGAVGRVLGRASAHRVLADVPG